MKASEIFEGENSSPRKTYEEATQPQTLTSPTGEKYVACNVCGMPCYGGYLTHIHCEGIMFSNNDLRL